MNKKSGRYFFLLNALTAPLLCMVIICQCVYFNLFYNAKSAFDAAYSAHSELLKKYPDSTTVALPPDVLANYDKAIDKASRIMEEYPKQKKWHDKAVFLIGKACFYKADYEKAIRTFKRLQQEFPGSAFVPESYLYIGRAYLLSGNLDKAEETFTFIIEKYPDLNKNQDVSLLLVDVAIRRGGRALAIDLLEKTSASVKSREKKIDIIIKTAHLAMDLKQFDKAIRLFKNCPRDRKHPEQLFRIDYGLAVCFEAKDSLQMALDAVMAMLNNRIYSTHTSEILLRKASLFKKLGKIDDAIEAYKSVTKADSTAEAAGVAWFELGTIYQKIKVDYVKAKECFTKASTIAKDTTMRSEAAQTIKSIDTLIFYRAMKDTVDTAKGIGRRDRIEFKIGELFWLELDQPDSAFTWFKRLSCKNDSLKPKALYSAAYIARHALHDTISADSLYKVLLNIYPANEFTKKTQEDRGEKPTIYTRQDSAQMAFAAAESLYFSGNDSEASVNSYRKVYEAFQDCEAGIKGLYAAAWISDNILCNHKTAFRLYRMLCDSFPKSEVCLNDVQARLKIVADTLAARKARRGGGATAMSDAPGKQKAPVAVPAAMPPSPALKADSTQGKSMASSVPGRDMYSRMRMMHPADSNKTLSPKSDSAKAIQPQAVSQSPISVAPAVQVHSMVPPANQATTGPKTTTQQNITISNDSTKTSPIMGDTAAAKK